jgi:hypothetical protein
MNRLDHSTTGAAVRYQHVMPTGRRHRSRAEPADQGRLSPYGTEMARRALSTSLPVRQAGAARA